MDAIEHASASRCRLGAAAATALVVLLATAGTMLLGAVPAHAVGNPTLSALIIRNPEPGWSNLSSTETGDLETQLQTEFQRLETKSQTFSSAVAGWQSPQGASSDSLVVFLVESIGSATQDMTAASLATGFCNGATGATDVSAPPISNVPDSAIATCSDSTQSVKVGTATKGNIVQLIASFGSSPLATTALEQVVGDQLDALPGPAPSNSSSSAGGSDTAVIIGGAGGGFVIVAGAVIAFILIRRRRAHPVVAGAGLPGAMPAPGPIASAPPVASAPPFASAPFVGSPPPVAGPSLAASPAPVTGPAQGGAGSPDQHGLPDLPGLPGLSDHDPFAVADPGWVSSLDAHAAPVHHADASVGSAPGWYPEGGDAETLRYWDGTTFTARRHWSGSDWVDA